MALEDISSSVDSPTDLGPLAALRFREPDAPSDTLRTHGGPAPTGSGITLQSFKNIEAPIGHLPSTGSPPPSLPIPGSSCNDRSA